MTCAAEKHLVSEKQLNKRFFKDTGVVPTGIECSPKISDFRANGIPVGERVDFFDTFIGAFKRLRCFLPLPSAKAFKLSVLPDVQAYITAVSASFSIILFLFDTANLSGVFNSSSGNTVSSGSGV